VGSGERTLQVLEHLRKIADGDPKMWVRPSKITRELGLTNSYAKGIMCRFKKEKLRGRRARGHREVVPPGSLLDQRPGAVKASGEEVGTEGRDFVLKENRLALEARGSLKVSAVSWRNFSV